MAELLRDKYVLMGDGAESPFLFVRHDVTEDKYHYTTRLEREFFAPYSGGDVILFLLRQQLIAPGEEEAFRLEVEQLQNGSKRYTDLYTRLKRRDGAYHVYRILLEQIHAESGELTKRLAILIDVDEEYHSIASLKRETEIDGLTGICNASAFSGQAGEMIQNNPDRQFAVVRMDIERFRVINDMLGMQRGDEVLVTVARVIEEFAAQEEPELFCYGRIRGDVFAMCFVHSRELLERVVNFCVRKVNERYPEYAITLDFGVYVVEDVKEPVSMMIDHANIASDFIRGNYLKRYAYYNKELHDSLINEQSVINGFEEALEKEQFYILLQPKCRADTTEIIGAEALVRWKHPEYGIVPPDAFIPVLEKKGLVYKLDIYVWEQVCKMLQRQKKQGKRLLPVSVNVSRVDLVQPDLCDVVSRLRETYGIDKDLLELEVTESAGVDSFKLYAKTVKNLHDLKFKILLDDFGSAYSTFNVLCNMEMDVIKVDLRSIYSEEAHTQRKNVMLRSLVLMAGEFGMEIVIEGVETKEQLDFLRSIGADYIQGYYFYKPMPVEEYERLL